MHSLLDAALEYATEHMPVFPCVVRGKEPAVARGFHAATTNPETIRRYWRIADRNIGIPTGSFAGFWVLDVDGADGEASLRAIEAQHGRLPPTRTVITGNGRHLWFANAGPIPSTASRIAPGIDTRGEGGYVIGPPSIHPSGRAYAWADRCVPLAVAPQWLVDLARRKPQPTISERAAANITARYSPNVYGAAALNAEIATLAATPPGGRNHALNRATFSLFQLVAGGVLDRNETTDALIAACHRNELIKDDGIRSVLATIRSGASAGMQLPRDRGTAS